VVTNPRDQAVNRDLTSGLVRSWRRRAPLRIETFEFPAALELGHDVIDPEQPNQRVDRVYPALLELIAGGGR